MPVKICFTFKKQSRKITLYTLAHPHSAKQTMQW